MSAMAIFLQLSPGFGCPRCAIAKFHFVDSYSPLACSTNIWGRCIESVVSGRFAGRDRVILLIENVTDNSFLSVLLKTSKREALNRLLSHVLQPNCGTNHRECRN